MRRRRIGPREAERQEGFLIRNAIGRGVSDIWKLPERGKYEGGCHDQVMDDSLIDCISVSARCGAMKGGKGWTLGSLEEPGDKKLFPSKEQRTDDGEINPIKHCPNINYSTTDIEIYHSRISADNKGESKHLIHE